MTPEEITAMAKEAGLNSYRIALAQAVALGLAEPEIRRMAKVPEWQLAPIESSAARPKSGG